MIDKDNTYFLVEDSKNNFYKMPIASLANLIVLNDEENDIINNLIQSIDELSTYILDLSADFISEHYSMEQLSSNFEFLTETDNLLIDKNNITENDVYKYINNKELVSKDKVNDMYDEEITDAETVFDTITNESDNYF